MTLVFPKSLDLINDDYPFMVANLSADKAISFSSILS